MSDEKLKVLIQLVDKFKEDLINLLDYQEGMGEGDYEATPTLAVESPAKPVKAAQNMDDETFIKHFNARHTPMAGLAQVIARPSDPGERMLREYHRRVHDKGIEDGREVNHTHREAK